MGVSRRAMLTAGLGAVAGGGAVIAAQGALRSRQQSASGQLRTKVLLKEHDGKRLITANGIPQHTMGDFPNPHDPIGIREQDYLFQMPLDPKVAQQGRPLDMWLFGVAVNGVPLDPSGPYWNGDESTGWQFEVLSPAAAVALGIDVNHAHTQGGGAYHYHGLPTGLLWRLRHEFPTVPMQLLGYAADGFPIYGPTAPGLADDPQSPVRRLRSSYRLRPGRRPDGPRGRFDGTFVEDYEYVEGFGDLDECNGRTGVTPEFPGGTYHYVLTDDFPFTPRIWRGQPDESFAHGPPPGVSAPVPPELRGYNGTA